MPVGPWSLQVLSSQSLLCLLTAGKANARCLALSKLQPAGICHKRLTILPIIPAPPPARVTSQKYSPSWAPLTASLSPWKNIQTPTQAAQPRVTHFLPVPRTHLACSASGGSHLLFPAGSVLPPPPAHLAHSPPRLRLNVPSSDSLPRPVSPSPLHSVLPAAVFQNILSFLAMVLNQKRLHPPRPGHLSKSGSILGCYNRGGGC